MESPYFPYGTYSYLLTGRDSDISLDSEANEEPLVLAVLELHMYVGKAVIYTCM